MRRYRATRTGTIAALALCLGAVACGDNGDDDSDTGRVGGNATTEEIAMQRGADAEPALTESVPSEQLAAASNAFAADIYGELAGKPGNLFFSPFSLQIALSMTLAGARGETAVEMREVLHLPGSGPGLHAGIAAWQERLRSATNDSLFELSIANRLWGQEGVEFLAPFLSTCRDRYGAELGAVDFGQSETARRTINDWVAEQTRDRIQDLIPGGALTRDTQLVLTNAIYFLGSWRHTFAAEATAEAPFFLAGGGEVPTPLMFQEERFRYAEIDGAQLLEMPYRDAPLTMLVVLPRERDGLAAVERRLAAADLEVWIQALRNRKVRVHLPRFETTASFRLNDILTRLGMTTAFTSQADFSGMTAAERLFISDVLHKAFVAVDEKGTEAAAATAIVMSRTSMPPPEDPVEFRADRPFLFLIRDLRTGTVLFLGLLVDPTG